MELSEEWWHASSHMVATVLLFTEGLMLDGVTPGSVVVLLTSVELMSQVWVWAEEASEEDFQVLIVNREDRVGREQGKWNIDDSQLGWLDVIMGKRW